MAHTQYQRKHTNAFNYMQIDTYSKFVNNYEAEKIAIQYLGVFSTPLFFRSIEIQLANWPCNKAETTSANKFAF